MAKVNSWGRAWKKQISLTFKKDEQIMEDFINEKVDPTSYIKELILKDMKLIKDNNANTINYNKSNKNDDNRGNGIDSATVEKLNKMFEL